MKTIIPASFSAENDREAGAVLAYLRETETVALIGSQPGQYRTVIFTAEQEAEAERLRYDVQRDLDGHRIVASRFLTEGERLIGVW